MKKGVNKMQSFGRYEKRLCLLLFLATVPNAFSALQFLSSHFTPDYICADQIEQVPINDRNENDYQMNNTESDLGNATVTSDKDKCFNYNVSANSVNEKQQRFPCDQFLFEGDYQTVPREFSLVCDKGWIKPTLVSIYMIGKMVGGMVGGIVSDRFGRKVCFLFFTALQFVVATLTSFSSSIAMYGFFMACSGCGSVCNFEAAVILGYEFLEADKRSFMYASIELGFAIGYMLLGPTAFLFTDWRWFFRFSGIIGVIYIPLFWMIDETPIWLIANGKNKEAEEVLNKVAKYNRTSNIDSERINSLIEEKQNVQEIKSTWQIVVGIAKAKILAGRLAIILFSWVIVTMTYYAIALNNDSLSGSRFINIFVGGVTEMFSTMFYLLGVNRLGRINSYIFLMVVTGLALGVTPFLAIVSGTANLVITMLAKLTIAICYNVIYATNSELFPTNVRSSILSFTSAFSRLGGIFAPFIIFAGDSGDTTTPSLGMAAAILLSAFSYLLLPETRNKPLPDTLDDAKLMQSKLTTMKICGTTSTNTETAEEMKRC